MMQVNLQIYDAVPTRYYLHVCVTIRRYLQLNEQYVDLTE